MADTQSASQGANYSAELTLLDQIVEDGKVGGRDVEAKARGKDLVKRFVAEASSRTRVRGADDG